MPTELRTGTSLHSNRPGRTRFGPSSSRQRPPQQASGTAVGPSWQRYAQRTVSAAPLPAVVVAGSAVGEDASAAYSYPWASLASKNRTRLDHAHRSPTSGSPKPMTRAMSCRSMAMRRGHLRPVPRCRHLFEPFLRLLSGSQFPGDERQDKRVGLEHPHVVEVSRSERAQHQANADERDLTGQLRSERRLWSFGRANTPLARIRPGGRSRYGWSPALRSE